MYYLDLDKGYDKPFVKRGFPVVSNGSRDYKPLGENSFLENFISHTKNKLYAFSNQLGSALFFANAMGLTSFYFETEINVDVSGSPLYKNLDVNQKFKENKTQFAHYFKFPDCDLVKQTEIVDRELGRDFMLSPAEMRNALWRCTL
ncbi:MAG: hypothetical protein ACOC04_03705 [Halothece sp.]